jgi:SAM-dependent methyltransferase
MAIHAEHGGLGSGAHAVCPICGCRSFSKFRFGLLRCSECGLVIDAVAIAEAHDAALQTEWFGTPEAARSPWVRKFEAWNDARTCARIRRFVQPPARVLEIGLGSGSLLAELRRVGFDVQGCDLSPEVGKYVSGVLGIPVFVGPIAEFSATASFDVVVMNHVVEHTSDPIRLLNDARRLAKPGALFHVKAPNVASWNAHLPGWTSYEPYHLVYFSKESLAEAVKRAGLTCLEVSTYEPFSGWFLAALRTAVGRRLQHAPGREKARRARSNGVEHAYRASMLAAGAALYPLRRLQSRLGAGEEIVLLATAPNHAP